MRLKHNRLYVNVLKMLISVNRGAEEPLPRPDGCAARTVTRKGMHSKRNPSPASERIIESAALPLTCALARWRFRFAGLLSRVNAWPFRFITLLRVKASVFLAKRNGDAFIGNHCFIDNPRANDVPLHRQPAHQRKRQLHSVWAHAVTETPCSARPHCHTGKATQVRAQTEPLTRQ